MGYKLAETTSLEGLIEYGIGVQAALEASEGLEALSKPSQSAESKCEAARADRDAARKAVIKASAKVRVARRAWSQTLTGVSARSFELANKNARQEPHNTLFGSTTAAQAKKFGPQRAVAFGKDVLSVGKPFKLPALEERLAPFSAENQRLSGLAAQHADAEDASQSHEAVRVTLRTGLQDLIGKTEAAILSKFPGQTDLVRAILVPSRATRSPRARLLALAPDLTDPAACD